MICRYTPVLLGASLLLVSKIAFAGSATLVTTASGKLDCETGETSFVGVAAGAGLYGMCRSETQTGYGSERSSSGDGFADRSAPESYESVAGLSFAYASQSVATDSRVEAGASGEVSDGVLDGGEEQSDLLTLSAVAVAAPDVASSDDPEGFEAATFEPGPLRRAELPGPELSGWLDIDDWVRKVVIHDWNSSDRLALISKSVWENSYDPTFSARSDVRVQLSSVVPLPATFWLVVIGLLTLAGYNSRKRRRTVFPG